MKAKNTQTTDASIQHYLRDIGQYPLLSRVEETEVARKIQAGDRAALETMINANLRLVVKVATDFNGLGVDLADLIAEGNIGLMTAAERFDPDRGAKFSTYAVLWIKQKIRRALSNQARTIRLPIHVVAESSELQRAERSLADELEREATVEELAAEMGMPAKKVARLRSLPSASVSLDATPFDNDLTLSEIIADESAAAPDDDLAQLWVEEQIESVMPALNERERTIIERRFGLDGSEPALLAELGEAFGVTRERVRQVQNAGLAKLKVELVNVDPYSFAGGGAEALSA
jgi:RNA polymerase primary sigma factor